MEATVMAAKRKASQPKPKKTLAIVVTLKGTTAWKAWVDELADVCRTDVSKLIDAALVDFAKSKGFAKEAPRR